MIRIAICLIAMSSACVAQDARLVSAAKETLRIAQERTFARGREFCGLLAVLPNGQIASTRPKRGRVDSCAPRDFLRNLNVVASYHTHGTYDPDSLSELPSSLDVLADREEGIDGFVATPGGRLWFIDGRRATVHLLCARGCVPADPNYRPDPNFQFKTRYTLRELRDVERSEGVSH